MKTCYTTIIIKTVCCLWRVKSRISETGQLRYQSVQSLSRVWLFAIPWIVARQASLSVTNSQGLLRLMSIERVMPTNHLILCRPLLLLPPIPPTIRVFSNESAFHMLRYRLAQISLTDFLQRCTCNWSRKDDLFTKWCWSRWISTD